jgi:hypothetical protein
MADFNIQPVGTQIKPVQPMSLADMVQMARGVQAYQQAEQINPLSLQVQQQQARTGQIALGVEEQKNKERLNLQDFFSNPSNFQTDGRIDLDKINAAVPSIAPLTGSEAIKRFTDLSTAQTQSEEAKNKLGLDLRKDIASRMSVLGRANVNDPKAYISELETLRKETPENKALHKYIDAQLHVLRDLPASPTVSQAAISQAQKLLSPTEQETAFAPRISTLSTGEQIFPVVTTPPVAGMLPRIQLGAQPLADVGLPPTTEVINPQTGQKELIGPASQRGQRPLVTGLGATQAGALQAQANVIGEDLPRTIAEAKDAPARIGIFQNIKKLTPEAFTGPTAERRQTIASFAQVLGLPVATLETSSTDELMKNTKLLQLAGGNTDAARALAEFANPNNKMTKEGIARVTDQLLGIEKMRLARAQYLTPAQNDAASYMQRKADFDAISDPRLFQEMTKEDALKMWNSMSKAQQDEIVQMRNKARQMGVLK